MFYNYVYLDPRKLGKFSYDEICFLYEPFYVGKGSGDRCNYHLKDIKRVDNPLFKNKIKKILSLNSSPIVVKLNYTNDEKLSYKNETSLIKEIGSNLIHNIKNGTLLNLCLENQPPSLKGKSYKEIYGDRWEEEIEKRREIQLKRGGYFGGKTHSEETKKRISESLMGEKNPNWGKNHSEETKNKISKKAKERLKENNPSWKKFKITSPLGEIFIVENGVKDFCEENGLSYSTLRKCLDTKKRPNRGKTKNWYIEYYE